MLTELLLSIPLGDAQWFDVTSGDHPVLVQREEDPDGPWFEIDGKCLSLTETLTLLRGDP